MSEGFDLKTHKRDSKTGKVLDENLYRRIAWSEGVGAEKTRHVVYERDGVYFTPDGAECDKPECLDVHAARVADIAAKQRARADERKRRLEARAQAARGAAAKHA